MVAVGHDPLTRVPPGTRQLPADAYVVLGPAIEVWCSQRPWSTLVLKKLSFTFTEREGFGARQFFGCLALGSDREPVTPSGPCVVTRYGRLHREITERWEIEN
jgi:hypothetical protein